MNPTKALAHPITLGVFPLPNRVMEVVAVYEDPETAETLTPDSVSRAFGDHTLLQKNMAPHFIWKHKIASIPASVAAISILACGGQLPTSSTPDLWEAAIKGNTTEISRLISENTDIDAREPTGGSSALMLACIYGQTEAAEALIKNGASLTLKNNDGATALHIAAFFCHKETVILLLEQGANPNSKNNSGQTPLESISGNWGKDVEGLYDYVIKIYDLNMSIDRIKNDRPKVVDVLSSQKKE